MKPVYTSCLKVWGEIPFSRIDVRKPQHPRQWQRLNENRSASIRAFRWKFASLPGKNFPISLRLTVRHFGRMEGARSWHGTRWRNIKKKRVWSGIIKSRFPLTNFLPRLSLLSFSLSYARKIQGNGQSAFNLSAFLITNHRKRSIIIRGYDPHWNFLLLTGFPFPSFRPLWGVDLSPFSFLWWFSPDPRPTRIMPDPAKHRS